MVKYMVAAVVFVLWELALFDTYTHCLTAEGFLQGWLGVIFHLIVLVMTWLAAMWFRDLQRN